MGSTTALRRWMLGVTVAISIGAQTAIGQTGTIDGRAIDSTLRGLAGVHVSLPGFAVETATDSAGLFRLTNVPPGDHLIVLRRLQFRPATTVVTVSAGDTSRIAVSLEPTVAELEAVEVRSTTIDAGLAEFERLRALGYGQYLTSSDIGKLNFASPAGVLSTFHSVSVQKAGVLNARSFPRRCPLRIFLDGVPIDLRSVDGDLPPPSEIAGLEIYVNTASVPVQYATYGGAGDAGGGGAFCGVILVWRKH